MRARLPALLLLALSACPRPAPVLPPPTPPPTLPPPTPRVPTGCEANLTGSYRHREDGTYRYDLVDDGEIVRLHAYRQYGSTRQELGAGADIELRRTATGFHGESHSTREILVQADGGPALKNCPVTFPYELTACSPERLSLRTLLRFNVREDCSVEDPLHLELVENVLLREAGPDAGPPPSPDAGLVAAPDAGEAPDAGLDAGPQPEAAGPADAGAPTDAG